MTGVQGQQDVVVTPVVIDLDLAEPGTECSVTQNNLPLLR